MTGRPAGPRADARTELDDLNDRALTLRRAKDFGAESISVNLRILELALDDHGARIRLGDAYRFAGDFDSAESLYRQILSDDGARFTDSETARRKLGKLPAERANGGWLSMAELLASVVNSNDARTRASAARDAEKTTAALAWSERAVELAEQQGRAALKRALATRASVLRLAKRSNDALQVSRRCVELDPSYEDNGPGYRVLVASLLDCGEVDEAVKIAQEVLVVDFDDAYAQATASRAFKAGFLAAGDLDLLAKSEACAARAAKLGTGKREAVDELRRIYEIHAKAGRNGDAGRIAAFLDSLGYDARPDGVQGEGRRRVG
jgi:tetratricopeptide (TPR) repeat protein